MRQVAKSYPTRAGRCRHPDGLPQTAVVLGRDPDLRTKPEVTVVVIDTWASREMRYELPIRSRWRSCLSAHVRPVLPLVCSVIFYDTGWKGAPKVAWQTILHGQDVGTAE